MSEWNEIQDSVPKYGDRVLFYDPKLNKCFQMVCFQDDDLRDKWKTSENFPFTLWKLWSEYPASLMNDCPFPDIGER